MNEDLFSKTKKQLFTIEGWYNANRQEEDHLILWVNKNC